ncbi:uncharacterized protein LOC111400523 [Olea europaea var. sylvestris]|uniref:uncharacterized protein LOC111400523 n=1 Tax=Olea europaea var. sylvestris TaxID=158386 RepID=UPI000C1D6A7E|nr:uncharacterized protein LOC111400523 [Olea europaea var. sylvestris]
MMTSNEWDNTKWSKSKKGKEAFDIVVPNDFWILINLCLRVFTPLVKVLRLVDGEEKPSMGFVYGELLKAKDDIIKTLKRESDYMPILNIIDLKGKDRIDSPLHTTAYLLNPFYFFKNPKIKDNQLITNNVILCVEKFFSDAQMQHHVINVELQRYTQKEGAYGRKLAACGCENTIRVFSCWWDFNGNETPNLKLMAKRILGLTTSSSSCERNWSVFEGVHTKKRNRLDATRMKNLVYVQFNASNAQSWIVDCCDDEEKADNILPSKRGNRNSQVEKREPDKDDFVSDDTENDLNEEDEIELESDKELDKI